MTDSSLGAIDTPQNRLILTVVAAVMASALFYYVIRAWRRRAGHRRLDNAIIAAGSEYLRNVLVPDGMGAFMHIDYLLLTSRGVLVVDLRDTRGNIFGGDQMTEWTVMNGASRSTFQNPQHALYDRVAAVRALCGDLPVEGRILFTRRGKFPKGLPRWTLMVDSLRQEFPPVDSEAAQSWIGRYREGWNVLCAAVSPSTLRRRSGFLAQVFTE
ncbi:MAG TPA: nuclease-related domain-containing protein [Steroidobacteraceae bacterium]|nr:nuclease-related domain-containing protein [Steroidobacteraceae bacterium]